MSYFDVSDAEGVELEESWDDVTSVDECVHGEHPLECALCTSAGTIAAVSGEGGIVKPEDHPNPEDDGSRALDVAIENMQTTALVALRYRIENELKRRAENYEREAKAARMALDNIKPRATRKDKGTTRKKEQAA